MILLRKEKILEMHHELILRFGGTDGISDEALLDSALAAPFQCFSGQELYPTVQAKAARLGYGLIKNHAMVDGNKRLGAHAMMTFLAVNGIEMEYSQEEAIEFFLGVAAGDKTLDQLLEWIIDHQR